MYLLKALNACVLCSMFSGAQVNGPNKDDDEKATRASPPSTPTRARQSSMKGVPSPLEITVRPASVC